VTSPPLSVAHVLGPGTAFDAAGMLARLQAGGWDAHLICDGAGELAMEGIAALPDEVVLRCVHPPPPGRRAGRARVTARLLVRLAGSLARNPPTVASTHRPPGATGPRRWWDGYGWAVIAALRPQIVHFHSVDAAGGRIAAARRLGAKAVVTLSDGYLAAVEQMRGDLAWLQAADALVVPSGPIARRAMRNGLPAERSVMLPLPVLRREPPDPGAGDCLRILSIGELTWRQGYEHGIHATRLLLDRGIDCRYRLAGSGSHEGALRFARRQLGIEDRVELVGGPERLDLGRQLAWADVLVDPSVADVPDGFVELAGELGLPVVAARRAPSGPAVDHVFEVRRRDPRALAARLAEIAAAPGLLEGRAARAAALEQPLTVEALVERLEALYLRLHEGRSPVGA
jgi:glycosyltransferase involved in cell wall biosynthesis